MYSNPNSELDSPPPRSQFRRPWSPEDLQAGPDHGVWRNVHMNDQDHSQSLQGMSSGRRQQRQEASDVSVEALDLADYARTLRARQAEDPYPPFPSRIAQPQPHRPPSAFPYLPQLASSRDSIAMHPSSLISRGPTSSSLGTHPTISSSAPSHARRATRRPYSLPPTPSGSSQPGRSVRSGHNNRHRYPHQAQDPHIVDPEVHPSADGIDISNFPKWSRGWYNSNNSHNLAAQLEDIYTPIPPSLFGSSRNKSNFGYPYDPYNAYDAPPPFSSVGHDASRSLLPWSMDPPEYGSPLHPTLKEERIRMLEKEFGSLGKKMTNKDGIFDEDGKLKVGTIDGKGNLVTSGPKRRIFVRLLQIILATGACVPAIYASLVIKPPDPNDPPPPANKPPIFVLYLLSSLTIILLLYLFLIRPCCVVRKPVSAKNPLINKGMIVLPVTGAGTKKGDKASKKGKNKSQGRGPGDVQVNLIVDPDAFRAPAEVSDDDDDENGSLHEGSQMIPGGFGDEERVRRKKKRNRRRGLIEGLKMEEEWKAARSWAKKVTAVDVAGLVLWGAEFVFIMLGQRCPSGGYNGWCNAYNVSIASACLLAVAFSVSLFYDVQDLHASKQSPRTRG